MKLILTIVMLFGIAKAQNGFDTIPCRIPVMDNTSYWNIYKSNGKILKTVTVVNAWDVPSGGWVSEEEFVNPATQVIKGFYIQKTTNWGTDSVSTVTIGYLDTKKKLLNSKWIVVDWQIPVNGYGNINPLLFQIK